MIGPCISGDLRLEAPLFHRPLGGVAVEQRQGQRGQGVHVEEDALLVFDRKLILFHFGIKNWP